MSFIPYVFLHITSFLYRLPFPFRIYFSSVFPYVHVSLCMSSCHSLFLYMFSFPFLISCFPSFLISICISSTHSSFLYRFPFSMLVLFAMFVFFCPAFMIDPFIFCFPYMHTSLPFQMYVVCFLMSFFPFVSLHSVPYFYTDFLFQSLCILLCVVIMSFFP